MAIVVLGAALRALGGTSQDSELENNVNLRLKSSVLTANFTLSATVRDGRAVLTGRVDTLQNRADAEAVLARTPGVTAIDDRVTIGTGGRGDASVEGEIRRAFEDRPALAGAGIGVASRGGKVTLTGRVDDARIRSAAQAVVEATPGALEVENRIETPKRSDDVIVSAAADWFGPAATRPIPGTITAVAKDGAVTLEGTVPRLWEKIEAGRAMWEIEGVRAVDNRLRVVADEGIPVIHP